jgi:hypothetical protein
MLTAKELMIRQALYFLCGAVIIGGAMLLQRYDVYETPTAANQAELK